VGCEVLDPGAAVELEPATVVLVVEDAWPCGRREIATTTARTAMTTITAPMRKDRVLRRCRLRRS